MAVGCAASSYYFCYAPQRWLPKHSSSTLRMARISLSASIKYRATAFISTARNAASGKIYRSALVDLTKTASEHKAEEDRRTADERAEDEEDKAVRAEQREIASIPMDPGAYYKRGGKMEAVPSADYQVITDKKRRAIQLISPVPLIPGKATVVVKGDHAKFIVPEARPSFYLRLAKEETVWYYAADA